MPSPVQVPLLNPKPVNPAPEASRVDAVDPAQRADSKANKDFDKALKSADKNQAKVNQSTEKRVAAEDQEAATEGNDLPVEEAKAEVAGAVTTSAPSIGFVDETLKLELGLNQFDTLEQLDDAVLLAARFVVDSLPAAVKEAGAEVSLAGNLTSGKPDSLVKLQSLLTGQQSGQKPMQLNLDSVAMGSLGELVQGKEQQSTSAATSLTVDAVQSQSNAAAELRAATAVSKPDLVVPNRVGSEGWSEAMAGRINLMVNQKISAARIHINPPELGPIEVRVNVNHDQASVQFTSQSAQVRDALEQSIPRLRDMLENAGFSLADSDVNDQSSGDGRHSDGEEVAESEEVRTESLKRESLGLVDQYV